MPWSPRLRVWGLATLTCISLASTTFAGQTLPQELENQWFAIEVLSGARLPLSSGVTLSPWSLIRLRLTPDERLWALFHAYTQDCTTRGDARLDPEHGRIHIRSHAITCRTPGGVETRVLSGTVMSETDGFQGVPLSFAHLSDDHKGYIVPAGVQGTLVVTSHDSPPRVDAPIPSRK